MTTELTGGEPGLVGYWRFNEGVGQRGARRHAERAPSGDAVQRRRRGRPGGPMGERRARHDAAGDRQHRGSNLTVDRA